MSWCLLETLSTTTGAKTTAYRKHIFCSGHAQMEMRRRAHVHDATFTVLSTTSEFIAKFLVLFFDFSLFFLRNIKKYLSGVYC